MSEDKLSLILEVKERFKEAFNNFNKGIETAGQYADKFGQKVQGVKDRMEKLQGTVGTAVGAFGGMSILKYSFDEFQKNEQALIKLNKAFDNSQGAIGLTKKELMDLRDEVDVKTLFGGDDIANAQAKLISFGTVGEDVFKRTTKVMADFATGTETDLTSAANMLGKALSNPTEALGLLSKQGINFTAVQEKMMKDMVEGGNIVGAQNMILDALEGKYKGMAEAATQGTGQIGLLKESFDEFAETLGGMMASFLVPMATFIRETVIPILSDWKEEIAIFTGVVAGLAVAWGAVSAAMMFLNPVTLIIAGVAAATVAAVKIWQNWGTIVDWLKEKFLQFKIATLSALEPIAGILEKMGINIKGSLDEAKKELDAFRSEQKTKAEAAAAEQVSITKKEGDEKLAAQKAYKNNLANINKDNKGKEALKKAEDERKKEEDEIKKKYGFLNKEDRKYLKEKEKDDQVRARLDVQAARATFTKMSKEEQEFYKDSKIFQNKEQKKQEREDQQKLRKKMKLTETMSSKQADMVIAEEQRVADEKEALETRKYMIENNIGDARLVAAQDFFGQMAQLQTLKSREMFEVGKAFAIGEAIMNTYTGITKTLATYPFPISAAMAAAQAALGFAQVQQISSSAPAFEDGGVVGGYVGATTGPDNIMANVRTGEMYLNARQQRNLFNRIDSDSLGTKQNPSQVVNNNYNVRISGNGDKSLKKMVEKTIETKEKRKLQKQQFVKGRFAT